VRILLIILCAFSIIPALAQENEIMVLQNNVEELEMKVDELTSSITAYNSNQTIMIGATLVLIAFTIISIFLNYRNTRKTLDIADIQLGHSERELKMKEDEMGLKTKESQALVKADLRVKLLDSVNMPRKYSDVEKHVFSLSFDVKNIGTVQADLIDVHYKIYDQAPTNLKEIVNDYSSIKKTGLVTEGSILPNNSKHYDIVRKDFSESKPRHVVIWLEYGHAEFEEETIYQINVKGGENQHSEYATHSTEDIDFART